MLGYYAGYQRDLMPVGEIDWSGMTHLIVTRVVPRRDGSLDTTFDIDESAGPAFARDIAKQARAHGVRPILMVGGAGTYDEFANAAANHRDSFITNLINAMNSYGFDGLDLDWEPILEADEPNVRALVRGLRSRLPNALLTMPVGWTSTTFPTVSSLYGALAQDLDRLAIMSYGMAGAWDGWNTWHSSALRGAKPNTPSAVEVSVQSYRAAGVPAGKLAVGIGYYGTCWAGGVNGPSQPIGSSSIVADDNTMSYTNIMRDYYQSSAYRYDAAADAPYLSFGAPRGPQRCTLITYENEASIKAKGAYAVNAGLGGAIIWTINQAHVLGGGDPLLRTTREAFKA